MWTIIATALCALATLYFCFVRGADVARHRVAALMADYRDARRYNLPIAIACTACLFWALITLLMLDRIACLTMAPA